MLQWTDAYMHETLDFEFDTFSVVCSFIGDALSYTSQNLIYSFGRWGDIHKITLI